MSSVEKLAELSDLFVSFARSLSKTLLLFNRVYWFVKKAFSLTFVLKLFL